MTTRIRGWLAGVREKFLKKSAPMAGHEVMRSLFDDMYADRGRVYRLNFFRGIFFGLGSVLGGTFILALGIYVLTWFVDFPLIGEWIERIIETLPG